MLALHLRSLLLGVYEQCVLVACAWHIGETLQCFCLVVHCSSVFPRCGSKLPLRCAFLFGGGSMGMLAPGFVLLALLPPWCTVPQSRSEPIPAGGRVPMYGSVCVFLGSLPRAMSGVCLRQVLAPREFTPKLFSHALSQVFFCKCILPLVLCPGEPLGRRTCVQALGIAALFSPRLLDRVGCCSMCSCMWLCAFALLCARDISGQCEMVAPPPM